MIDSFRNKMMYYGWWFLWAFFHFWVLYSMGWSAYISLTESLVSSFILMIFGLSLSVTIKYYRPSDSKVVFLFIWAALLSLAWVYLTKGIMYIYAGSAYMMFYDLSIPVRSMTGLLLMSSFISILYVFFNEKSKAEQEKLKMDTETLARQTELSALRDQLQPHFLFNTLNSIHALVGSRPEEARKMIVQLSDFLRGNLTGETKSMVTLKEELSHLQLYLDIEKVRFGHRLDVVHDIDVPSESLRLPSLLLQPLIENSIKYGLYDTLEKVTITIKTWIDGKDLMIEVSNPFERGTSTKKKGTGFGQSSAKRRLFLLYGRQDLFTVSEEQQLYKVTLRIPQQ
jgi:two-component system, LytTR family, sensor kinase